MLKKEVAVELMRHLVEHDYHGYDQNARWGDGEGVCDVDVGGVIYHVNQGDRDCSSAVISAYQDAGVYCGGATYTGNMRDCMCGTGNFVWHPMASGFVAQAGDIYLNEACHTAMCLSAEPDMLMQFSLSENGGIYGATGDSTGGESAIMPYYDYPWDGILECVNGEQADGTAASGGQASSAPSTGTGGSAPEGIEYCVYTPQSGWLPPVADLSDFAGIQGQPITRIAINLGGHGWYQVCTREHGWLEPVTGYDLNDENNGWAGYQGSGIVAVRVYYETTNPGATGYWRAQYRVSNVGCDYFDWQFDNETGDGQDGFAGDGVNLIDRLQVTLAR